MKRNTADGLFAKPSIFRRIWISWLRRVEKIRVKRHEHECRSAAQDQKGTRKEARGQRLTEIHHSKGRGDYQTGPLPTFRSMVFDQARRNSSAEGRHSATPALSFPRLAPSTDTHSPFGALIVVYFSLSCGITAAIKIAPVKRVVSHALAISHQERATDSLAALTAIVARFAILPGGIDLDQGKVRLARRRSGERHIGSKCSLEVAKGQHISIPDQTRAHVCVFPELKRTEKPIAKGGCQKVESNTCDNAESSATDKKKTGSCPL